MPNDLESPQVVVHLVHGTFARGIVQQVRRNLRAAWCRLRRRPFLEEHISPAQNPDPDRRFWFEEGSRFQRAVNRCLWADADSVRFERLLWSGSNTFDARLDGAAALMVHLRAARRRYPAAKHLVVAHSHGGTVAAIALARDEERGTPVADGLMTLGTPFVRLVMRQRGRNPSPGAVLIGGLLPAFSLSLGPLLSLSLLLRGETWSWLALVLFVLAGIGAVGRQAPLTAAIAAVVLGIGGEGVRSDALALGILAVALALVLVNKTRWALNLVGFDYVQREPFDFGCPLVAIRTPNDEASLTIGLAQTVERAYRLASGLLVSAIAGITMPLRRFEQNAGKIHPWFSGVFVAVCIMVPLIAIVVARDWWKGISREWWEYALVGGYLPGVLLAAVASAAVLLWLIPGILLSLAAGPESFAAPLIGLDAEPLPFAEPHDQMRLIIDVKAGRSSPGAALNHSLHDGRRIRIRVASWIRAHVDQRNNVTGRSRVV